MIRPVLLAWCEDRLYQVCEHCEALYNCYALIFVSAADFSFENILETHSWHPLEMGKREPHAMTVIPGGVLWEELKLGVTVDPDVSQAREPQVIYSAILSFSWILIHKSR